MSDFRGKRADIIHLDDLNTLSQEEMDEIFKPFDIVYLRKPGSLITKEQSDILQKIANQEIYLSSNDSNLTEEEDEI